MTSVALFLLLVALLSRLPLLFRDGPIRRRDALAAWGIQACLVLGFLRMNWGPVLFLVLLLVLHLIWAHLERRGAWTGQLQAGGAALEPSLHRMRLHMLLALVLLACFAGSTRLGFELRRTEAFLQAAGAWFTPLDLLTSLQGREVLVGGCGFLACVSESNGALRWIIERMQLRPKGVGDALEYRRGRLIGVLERMLIFVLVMQAQYGALAFVLAAKSMARFKSLDDREFAEYFLLGTLLSVLLAGVLGMVVRRSLA